MSHFSKNGLSKMECFRNIAKYSTDHLQNMGLLLIPKRHNVRPSMTRRPATPTKGLVTNYGEGGGLLNGRGACEVLPLRKVLAMLKGGHNKFWGSFYAIWKGGRKRFNLSRGGGRKKFRPRNFPIL